MTDAADSANDLAQFNTELALRQRELERQRAGSLQQVVNGVVECRDCGVDIPPGRLAALSNCVRCVDCQIAYEKELRLGL